MEDISKSIHEQIRLYKISEDAVKSAANSLSWLDLSYKTLIELFEVGDLTMISTLDMKRAIYENNVKLCKSIKSELLEKRVKIIKMMKELFEAYNTLNDFLIVNECAKDKKIDKIDDDVLTSIENLVDPQKTKYSYDSQGNIL